VFFDCLLNCEEGLSIVPKALSISISASSMVKSKVLLFWLENVVDFFDWFEKVAIIEQLSCEVMLPPHWLVSPQAG